MVKQMVLAGLGALVGSALFASQPADAHTRLTNPTPRSPADGLKTGPCGGVERTSQPMVVTAGETVTISWLETVEHPGYYRIALAPEGDQGFDDNVLADNIADISCTSTPCSYTQDIVIPDIECDSCTLQMIQYMGRAAPYSPYFSCADIEIIGADTGSPDAGAGEGDPDGANSGGCSISGTEGGAGLITLLLICVVLGYVCGSTRRSGRGKNHSGNSARTPSNHRK